MASKTIKTCDGCHKEVMTAFLEIQTGLVRLNNGRKGDHTIGYGEKEIKDKIACSDPCLKTILYRLFPLNGYETTDYFPIGLGGSNLKDPNNYDKK